MKQIKQKIEIKNTKVSEAYSIKGLDSNEVIVATRPSERIEINCLTLIDGQEIKHSISLTREEIKNLLKEDSAPIIRQQSSKTTHGNLSLQFQK